MIFPINQQFSFKSTIEKFFYVSLRTPRWISKKGEDRVSRRRRKRASTEKIRRSASPLLRPISLLLALRARGQRKQQHRSNNRQTTRRKLRSYRAPVFALNFFLGRALFLSPSLSFSPFPRSGIGSRGWKECTCQTLACTRTRPGR